MILSSTDRDTIKHIEHGAFLVSIRCKGCGCRLDRHGNAGCNTCESCTATPATIATAAGRPVPESR